MHTHGSPTGKTQAVLQVSLAATLIYVAVCFFVGLHAHSLSLLSEAGHNISDAAALLLSFVAVWLNARPANDAKTFGYQRAGVLAAFFNALALVAVSTWIAIEALGRLGHPEAVASTPMMLVAAAGVLMNGLIATMLWRVGRSGGGSDVNLRSVFIHMLGDTLSTAAVIVGGLVIRLTHLNWIDPALSLAIAALILWSSISIARETLNILLEGTPEGIALPAIRAALTGIEGVEDVHDLHVWSLGSQTHALATHIRIADIPPSESNIILDRVKSALRDRFQILHTTIQFENCDCVTEHGCVMAQEEALAHAAHPGHHHGHDHHGHAH
ncbi:cation diffusion facilitator family transporter [Acidipila sp. EB88]|uniref:cation diffusion facilitator family transporter n=1 Tax=Acidipila sp. EB88 TaxID=2305226 RepID=UPI000F5F2181|nr:cation diffusion facilitator family transporter [Acidipila sp. EB88]RRA48009.1 cation transporter [Acidipila sp. EB88]